MLTVATPASDRSLLTLAELRTAAGVTDGSKDAALVSLGAQVAAVLAKACRIPGDGVTPPTFRLETLIETLDLEAFQERLILSRRPVVSIASIIAPGVTFTTDDYRLEAGAGLLQRRIYGNRALWPACDIIVTYDAGWAVIPDDLKFAAAKAVTMFWWEIGRDPNLKREQIEDVAAFEYWVSPASDSLLSQEILDLLGPYMNYRM